MRQPSVRRPFAKLVPFSPYLALFMVVACGSSAAPEIPAGGGNGTENGVPPGTDPAVTDPSGKPIKPNTSGSTGKAGLVLLADNNRSGVVELDDATEEAGRDTWDGKHGAVFMANIDDDEVRCSKTGTDDDMAACNDAADDVINGEDDLLDLAPIVTKPWAKVPEGTTATISVSDAAAPYVRLFRKVDGDYVVFDPANDTFDEAALKAGLDIRVEGTDIVRDLDVWDGFLDLAITATQGGKTIDSDKIRMRMAPVVTPSHLETPTQVYSANVDSEFNGELDLAGKAASLPKLYTFKVQDQWAQDYFEPAYMTMPGKDGAHVMHVNYRSANYSKNGGLRRAGRVVFEMRGKDVGAVVAFDPNHKSSMDTLDSFGNFETIPPYSFDGKDYPLGRVIRGKSSVYYPDATFTKMVEAQQVQPPVYVDTAWLVVGHVDEFVTFVPANTPRGWALVVANPARAITMLQDMKNAGQGALVMHENKFWLDDQGETSANKTINAVLADSQLMTATQQAQAKIDKAMTLIKAETGLGDDEIIKVPFLFESSFGALVAYQPGMVNGVVLGKHFASPRPHGPKVGGKDVFEKATEDAMATRGMTVHWVEDWDTYHRNLGEVHCGSNTRRVPSKNFFWTGAR